MKIAILIGIGYFVIGPVLGLVHELAHALPALLSGGRAQIALGSASSVHWSLGRLTISVGANSLLRPWHGVVRCSGTERFPALTPAMGPMASLSMGAVCLVAAGQAPGWALEFLLLFSSCWCLTQGVFTALPLRYPQWMGFDESAESDGLRVLRALQCGSPPLPAASAMPHAKEDRSSE